MRLVTSHTVEDRLRPLLHADPFPKKKKKKNADGYANVAVQQLAELLASKDYALINVHIPYAEGRDSWY